MDGLACRRHRTLPLSWIQESLWADLDRRESAECINATVRLHGKLNRRALLAALDRIVARHELLRTIFRQEQREAVQVVESPGSGFALSEQQSLGGKTLEALRREEIGMPFDLESEPLIRGRLIRLSKQEHVLLITQHRLISDRRSLVILIRELAALYEAIALGRKDPLPALQQQYVDYATWLKQRITEKELESQLRIWDRILEASSDPLHLPTDSPRTGMSEHVVERIDFQLSASTVVELHELARRQNVNPSVVVLTAWAIVLSRWSGQERVLVGARLANRPHESLNALIGVFENFAMLPILVQGNSTIEQLLKSGHDIFDVALTYPDLPFSRLIKSVAPVKIAGLLPRAVFEIDAPRLSHMEISSAGLKFSDVSIEESGSSWEISLSFDAHAEIGTGTLEYRRDLFQRSSMERHLRQLQVLLESLPQDSQKVVSSLPTMNAAERNQVLYEFNQTSTQYPNNMIHEIFEECVRRTPAATAVVDERSALTYDELNRRANQLARHLKKMGVGPEMRVALCIERSAAVIVGILGVLKAGATYVPLDPDYPGERLLYMLRDAEPHVILTQEKTKHVVAQAGVCLSLDEQWAEISKEATSNLEPVAGTLHPGFAAYVIYTSGSTGEPKGVVIEHRNVVSFWNSLQRSVYQDHSDCSRVALNGPFTFDASVQQWVQLLSGRTLFLIPQDVRVDGRRVVQFLRENKIETLDCTPSQLKSLLTVKLLEDNSVPSLRFIIVGGEAIDARLWTTLTSHSALAFYNVYGPTECTVDSTTARLSGSVPHIGRPLGNSRTYILDSARRPVPVGVVGELYIAGANVGRGYLNRPELTAERFLTDPFHPDERMYKTGDLGRWNLDGTIEYLGRNDDQVKIRGFRIELGEIESRLSLHSQVKEVAVVARADEFGEKLLVAYVTAWHSADKPSVHELRAFLRTSLPEHMVPSAFVVLEHMPFTSSGKLHRQALPAPGLTAFTSEEYEPPESEVERTLASIWQELLHVQRVGRRDNFFELGGHSLLLVQMMDRLRAVGLLADVQSVFKSPRLAELSATLRRETGADIEVPPNCIPKDCELLTPEMLTLVDLDQQQINNLVLSVSGGARNIQDVYPLAPLQEGMLFHHLLHEQGDPYVLSTILELASRNELDALVGALQKVIDRHDVLRSAVIWEQLPRPLQVVLRRAALPIEELVLNQDSPPMEQLRAHTSPDRARLDLRRAPLMRLAIAADPHSSRWYALLQAHHLVSDHESVEALLEETRCFLNGRVNALASPMPYRNHVAQALRHSQLQDAESFFRNKLGAIDEPTIAFGQTNVRADGHQSQEFSEDLGAALARRVRAQAKRLGVSAAALFHAAWSIVVARTSGREDVVFGTVLLGRLQGSAGSQRTLGMFINTLPLRLQVQGLTVKALVEHTQRELAELLSHEQASLATAQRCSGIEGATPLFNTLLNFLHGKPSAEANNPHLAPGVSVRANIEWTNYPVVLSIEDRRDAFQLIAQAHRSIDPARITSYMRVAVDSLVTALENGPERATSTLSMLPAEERRKLLEQLNPAQSPYPHDQPIHEVFEAQVERAPDAVAVLYEKEALTYAELNARANQLAHYLLAHGAQPGDRVPLVMPRGLNLLIAELAVLKCGCAYAPIDPRLPHERQELILSDLSSRIVVTDNAAAERPQQLAQRWIDCVAATEEIARMSHKNPALRVLATQAAYVMYTSGSTGTPKGVVVQHRSVNNLVVNNTYASFSSSDVFSQSSNPAFDASTFEIWGALLNGARLVIVPAAVLFDAERFALLIKEQRVTILWITVGLLTQYLEILSGVWGELRYLVTGGDVVDPRTVNRVMGRRSRPNAMLNCYGPTESTTFATTYLIEEAQDEWRSIPIGRPIANSQIYILDRNLQPVPCGVAGEIYVGGTGVALGYLNRETLTAERFVSNPFSSDCNARLYKTGDIGRWSADGNIEFLGRTDQQVKLRGFRVELGEIEAHLERHADVDKAVVVVHQDVSTGNKRIVAYVKWRNGFEQSYSDLRARMKAALPDFMIPSAYFTVANFPLTSSGKLDRHALPKPDHLADVSGKHSAPQGELEKLLAEIWRDLLHLPQVGRDENFFDLGGHSLLAMQVITRAREALLIEIPFNSLFEHSTVAGLAGYLNKLQQARLVDEISVADSHVHELLEQVAAMSDSKVQELVRELTRRKI